ncbi:MAG TPA: LacI family DNA-binding transcriptional regulator [Symbiobacteriaceae bacterium]
MAVTIKDVAREAGVGLATVSRVLNNSGPVSPETRERVLAAARALGYVPNLHARSLVSRATGTVGLIIPDITNPFFPAVTRGVEDAASQAGYTVFLCNTDNDPAKEETDVRKLRERCVDGIIFVGSQARRKRLERLLQDGIPVVVTDREVPDLDADSVLVDNNWGARAAVRHLIDLGHTRIAHAAGHRQTPTGQDRYAGYCAALEEAGLPVDESLVFWGEFTIESGIQAGQVLLGRSPRPTAVFAGNDLIALGVIRAAREAGLRVPEDLSVVGFDDIPLAALVSPPLTTVRQPAYEMGRLAMTMLLERMSGRVTGAGRHHVFRPELILRGSTRPRSGQDLG